MTFPRNLAQFKAWLRKPGVSVTVVQHDWATTVVHGNAGNTTMGPGRALDTKRNVKSVQTNGVYFEDNGWLAFPKSKCLRFDSQEGTVDVCLRDDASFQDIMRYQLHEAE